MYLRVYVPVCVHMCVNVCACMCVEVVWGEGSVELMNMINVPFSSNQIPFYFLKKRLHFGFG